MRAHVALVGQGYIDGAAMTGQPEFLQKLGVSVLKSKPLRMFANKIAYSDPDRFGTEDAMRQEDPAVVVPCRHPCGFRDWYLGVEWGPHRCCLAVVVCVLPLPRCALWGIIVLFWS